MYRTPKSFEVTNQVHQLQKCNLCGFSKICNLHSAKRNVLFLKQIDFIPLTCQQFDLYGIKKLYFSNPNLGEWKVFHCSPFLPPILPSCRTASSDQKFESKFLVLFHSLLLIKPITCNRLKTVKEPEATVKRPVLIPNQQRDLSQCSALFVGHRQAACSQY